MTQELVKITQASIRNIVGAVNHRAPGLVGNDNKCYINCNRRFRNVVESLKSCNIFYKNIIHHLKQNQL